MEQRLHRLERREFLRRERRSQVAGERQYAFRHVLVRDVAATLEKVVAGGGKVVEDTHGEPPELYAQFADPTGNVLGLFEEGGR